MASKTTEKRLIANRKKLKSKVAKANSNKPRNNCDVLILTEKSYIFKIGLDSLGTIRYYHIVIVKKI